MADDDERDAKNPIVEEPKSHSKGAWTLEEAIVDIDALIAAQAERRQFVAPKINYAGRCGAIIIGLLIPLIIFAGASLTSLPGRDRRAFDYWLSLFVSSGAVYGGLCQGDEGTAQTDWAAVDTMKQRIFGYVGAHHGRMGKLGIGRKGKVQNLQHYDDTGRLTGKERLRRFWQLAVKFAYGGALTGLAVARPYATACRAELFAPTNCLFCAWSLTACAFALGHGPWAFGTCGSAAPLDGREGIARANNKTHLAAIHARAKIFNVVDAIATVIRLVRESTLAVVATDLADYVKRLGERRVRDIEATGASGAAMADFKLPAQRKEVKAMVRVFDLFFDEINRQENGSYRFLHVGGLSAAETEALAAFHESTGAYLAHDRRVPRPRRYVAFLTKLADKSKGTYMKCTIKGFWRIAEKMGMHPDGGGYDRAHVAELLDVVRGSLRFENMKHLQNALLLLQCCDVTDADTPDVVMDQRIEIVRVKNRFIEPTSGGWADAMINFRFLIHNDMLMVRKDWGAHESYSIFRTSIQLLEAAGPEYFKLVTEIDALTASELEKKRHLVSKKEEDVDAALEPLRLELDAWMEEVDPDNEHHIASHDGVALSHDAQKIR
ncbi:hypothetical protein JL721_12315 [Aureococcus anophagefferens]|nr:hypothetical protein JL721_12315 [Aureococcus anophagefferens]